MEHRLQPLEHAFDPPTLAVQAGDSGRLDAGGQVAPEPEQMLARLRRLVEFDLDASPGLPFAWGTGNRRNIDTLLTYPPGLNVRPFAPSVFFHQPGMVGVFAYDERSPRPAESLHDGACRSGDRQSILVQARPYPSTSARLSARSCAHPRVARYRRPGRCPGRAPPAYAQAVPHHDNHAMAPAASRWQADGCRPEPVVANPPDWPRLPAQPSSAQGAWRCPAPAHAGSPVRCG